MTIAPAASATLPRVSFGPFWFLEVLPWLVLAAAMRAIAFGGGPVAFPSIVIASIAVLHAFLVAQRSIERANGDAADPDLRPEAVRRPRLTRTGFHPRINSEGMLRSKAL